MSEITQKNPFRLTAWCCDRTIKRSQITKARMLFRRSLVRISPRIRAKKIMIIAIEKLVRVWGSLHKSKLTKSCQKTHSQKVCV